MKKIMSLYLCVFIAYVGYSMSFPVLSNLILTKTQLGSFFLGVLLSMYPLGQFFGSPLIGGLSDVYGRKKILLLSLIMTLICYLGAALFLSNQEWGWLLVMFFLAGFFEGNVAIAQSVIADSGGKCKSKRFGLIYFATSFAFVVGPLLGAFVSNPKVFFWFSDATPYLLISFALLVAILGVIFSFEEKNKKTSSQAVFFNSLKEVYTFFFNKEWRVYFFINFIIYLSLFGFFRAFPIYAIDRFHLSLTSLSAFIAYTSLPIMFVNSFLIAPLLRRYSSKQVSGCASILTGLSVCVLLFPKSPDYLWVTLFLVVFFLSIAITSCALMISDLAKNYEQGKALGVNQAIQFGAEALASMLAGFFASYGVFLPLSFFSMLAVFSGFLLLIKVRRVYAKRTDALSY